MYFNPINPIHVSPGILAPAKSRIPSMNIKTTYSWLSPQ